MGNKCMQGLQGKNVATGNNDVSVQLSDDALNQMLDDKAGIGGDGGPPRGAYPTLELEGIPLDGIPLDAMEGGGTLESDATKYGAQHITTESGAASNWDGQSALSGSQWNAQSQQSGAIESMRSGATESMRSGAQSSQWGGQSQRSGATESMRSQSQWGGESQRSGTAESMRSGAQSSQWGGASEAGMSTLYDDMSLPTDSTRPPTLPARTPGMFVSGRSKVSSMASRDSRATSRAQSTAQSRAPSTAQSRAPSVATSRAPSFATSRAPSTATSRAPSTMESPNPLMAKESKMSDFNADQRFSEAPSVRQSGYSEYSEYSEYDEGSRAPSERSRWTESTGYSEYPDEQSRMSAMSGMSSATGQLDGVRSVSQGQPSNAGSRSVRGSKISTRSGMSSRQPSSRQPSARGASTRSSSRSNARSQRSTTRGSSRRTGRSTNSVWTKGGKGRETRGDIAGIPENELYEKDSQASGWTEAESEVSGYTQASRAQSRAQSTQAQSTIHENQRESTGWTGTEATGHDPPTAAMGGHSRYRKNGNGQWKATQSTRNNFTPNAFRRVTIAVQALGFGGISRTGKTAKHHDKARDYFKSVNPQAGTFTSGPPPVGKFGPGSGSSKGWGSSASGSGGSGSDVKRVAEGSVRKPMPSSWGRVVGNHWTNLFGGGGGRAESARN
jgi:hypothetical protein